MLIPQSRNVGPQNRQKLQDIQSIPAPVGGINARDSIAAMPPTDAIGLLNWIPQQYGVRSRKGYQEWAIGMGGVPVRDILTWFGPTTTIPTTANFQVAPTTMPGKVFAATDAAIYDITSQTTTPSTAVTLSNTLNAGSISAVNFANSAGGWTLACSETDGYYTYDGTTWLHVSLGAGGTQVLGIDPTTFAAVNIWKRRAFFVVKNSAAIWYLPVDSLYGTAQKLDLGPEMPHGGAIAWIANWTIDAGEGIDDLLVIASENGDIIIYKGTDPASITTFSLVGVWYAGEIPKGRKCFTKFGGDLLIVSNLGLIPLSYITRGGANVLGTGTGNYTDKIQQLFGIDISSTFNFFGWQAMQLPRENLLILTVPNTAAGVYTQYVMNTINNQWCQFSSMPMNCVRNVANWAMFGTIDGRVCLAFNGFTDNALLNGTPGVAITGLIQPAFSYFPKDGGVSGNKHFLMVKPTFMSTVKPGVVLAMNVNFMIAPPIGTPIPGASTGAVWDGATWDVSVWGGLSSVYSDWLSVEGLGYTGQVSMATAVNADTTLVSIDYMMEPGGPM